MFSFLRRDLPAAGYVLYPGPLPPPFESLSVFQNPVTWTPNAPAPNQSWAVEAAHPHWGTADIACQRNSVPLPQELIDHSPALTAAEKGLARRGQATISIRVRTHEKLVLRDRKRLLFWLRALMQSDGAIAFDGESTVLWSAAMLDDELAHDADLDIEALYTLHAVKSPDREGEVSWLHTHGLEALGAFDVDVLEPSRMVVENCGDPFRALAFAALEGAIEPDTARFQLAWPGGEIRLVPVREFHAHASPEHQHLRDLDSHAGRRAVVCEPIGGLFGRWRTKPVPSRFLSNLNDDHIVFPFSSAATMLMAERGRQTVGVFRDLMTEFASLDLPALVKLGYEVDGGGPDDFEHLWFQVHAITGDTVDATLGNSPNGIARLTLGQRGEHGLDRLTDWTIMSPEGAMTPRNISAARRLRDTRSVWQARIDAAPRESR
jgi:uncharacterized protein DUF2314